MPDILVFSALVPRLFGARVILDLHDPMPELMMSIYGKAEDSGFVRTLKIFERWSIRFAHLVLTPNISFQKLFVMRGCPPEKLRVIMNSPDEGIFPFNEIKGGGSVNRDPQRPLVVMYHGAIVERHGLDSAVKAFHSIRSAVPNAELHIYGRSTPFLEEVLTLVKKLGIESAVKYHGQKSLEQIVKAIDECDFGVIPNRDNVFTAINMPTRIFEYLARGKAVIAPRTTGIQDYFAEEEICYFKPGDEADLADKLKGLLTSRERLRDLAAKGQAVYRVHRWTEERKSFVESVARLFAAR